MSFGVQFFMLSVLLYQLYWYATTAIPLIHESGGNDWVPMSRGLGRDVADGHGGLQAENGLSELHIRNMFDSWSTYMAGA